MEITNTKKAELIQQSNDYTVKSLFLKGTNDSVDWTVNFFYINPHKQSKVITIPSTSPTSRNRAFYQVMSDNVFFVINEKTTVLNKGQLFVVNQGLRHYFFNPNNYIAIVIMNYPGKLAFKKNIDTVNDLMPQIERRQKTPEQKFVELDPFSS